MDKSGNGWFAVERLDPDSYVISEWRHWEETHCYLLTGAERGLLIDTGLGVCDIGAVVRGLTALPVTAAATHVHWDHIGGHRHFPDFYVHREERGWLDGGFPLPLEAVKGMIADRCELPEGYDADGYRIFQGTPARVLEDGDAIDLGGRVLQVLHTPGHSPGHMCFWEPARGYLFTGDLVYKGVLFADYPSTDPQAYLKSLERVAALPVKRVFPGYHTLEVGPELPVRMRDAFRALDREGKLRHGGGTFDYGDWSVRM